MRVRWPLPRDLEPLDHIAIEAQVDGGFAAGHDDARGLPEIRAERFGLGASRRVRIFAALTEGLDLAKGISHDSRFLLHLYLPSGR